MRPWSGARAASQSAFPNPGPGACEGLPQGGRWSPALVPEGDGAGAPTQPPRHPDLVPDLGPCPVTRRLRAAQDHQTQVHPRSRRPGEVPSEDLDSLPLHRRPRHPPWSSERHRSAVAGSSAMERRTPMGSAAMAARSLRARCGGPKTRLLQGNPLSAEVDPLHGEVGADHQPTLHHGAIVPGPSQNLGPGGALPAREDSRMRSNSPPGPNGTRLKPVLERPPHCLLLDPARPIIGRDPDRTERREDPAPNLRSPSS